MHPRGPPGRTCGARARVVAIVAAQGTPCASCGPSGVPRPVAGYRSAGGAGSFYCSTDLWRWVAGDLPAPEPAWRVRVQILDRRLAGEQLPDDDAGDAREEDAVAAVAGRVPESRQPRLGADDRPPVGRDRPEPSPRPLDSRAAEGRAERGCGAKQPRKPGGRGLRPEADVFHGRAQDRLVAAGHEIAAVAVDDRPARALGPGQRRHLAAHRCYRYWTRNTLDRTRPGARGQKHVRGIVAISLPYHASDAIAALQDGQRQIVVHGCTEACRIGQQRGHQLFGFERAFARRPQGSGSHAEPRPAGPDLLRIQPVAEE